MNTGIYILYHINKPEVLYVGSTSKLGFKQRFNNHMNELKSNKHNNSHLQNVANKYNLEGFRFKILQKILPKYCIEAEQYWIDTLNTYNKGYNQSKKAGCVSMPYEERRIATKKQQKTVIQIDKNNKIINKFKGVLLASRKTGINKTDISFCCNNKVKMAGGYLWCFEENYNENVKYKSNYNNFGLLQYNKNGNFIKKWNTIQEAANKYAKGKNGNIYKACKDFSKSAYSYKWQYATV